MATTETARWPIWTDGGTGSTMAGTAGTAGAATWVYRLPDGSYLTVGPDETGERREVTWAERPRTPDGFPIPLQWHRLAARLPAGGQPRHWSPTWKPRAAGATGTSCCGWRRPSGPTRLPQPC